MKRGQPSTKTNVVPLKPRHKFIPGDGMELKVGNSLVIIHPCEATEEEQKQAEYELHMAAWSIIEEAFEKGEAV